MHLKVKAVVNWAVPNWAALICAVLSGAVLAAACTPAEGPRAGPVREELTFVGAEPFWGVEVSQLTSQTIFTRPDYPAVIAALPERTVKGKIQTLTAKAAGGEATGDIVIAMRVEACSDGMSSRVYPWAAEVTWQGKTMTGCGILTTEFARSRG